MSKYLRSFALVAALLFVASPASAQDGGSPSGFNLEADIGLAQFFNGGPTGFGLNLRPGYRLPFGLVIEGNLGVHTGKKSGVSQTVIPFMVGATYGFDLGAVRPFAGLHFGAAVLRVKVPGFGNVFGVTPTASTTSGAFNVGGGADYMVTDSFGVGGSLWFWSFFSSGAGSATMMNVGAHVAYTF